MNFSPNEKHEKRFQAIRGDSAVQSGIHNIPTVLSVGKYIPTHVGTKLHLLEDRKGADYECSGICNCRRLRRHCHWILYPIHDCRIDDHGYWCRPTSLVQSRYTPVDVVCDSELMKYGVSSLTYLRLGFQIVFGAGAGIGLELPNIAVQTVLPEKDVSTGTSLVVFARSLGGAIFVSAGQTVFSNHIVSGMLSQVPELDPSVVLQSGATDLQQTVSQATLGQTDIVARVLKVYNDAILQTFVVALALACISIIGAVGVEWRTVKRSSKGQNVTVNG